MQSRELVEGAGKQSWTPGRNENTLPCATYMLPKEAAPRFPRLPKHKSQQHTFRAVHVQYPLQVAIALELHELGHYSTVFPRQSLSVQGIQGCWRTVHPIEGVFLGTAV
eukprot:1137851-Pelagomonas_calceolata.AAC.5